MSTYSSVAAVSAVFIASVTLAGPAVPIPVDVVLAEGDAIAGDTVDILSGVDVTGDDVVGFNASLLTSGDRFVWVGNGPAVFNSDFVPVVTGAEGSTGVSSAGNWIYSPSVDGNDSVIFDDGLIVSETQSSFDGLPGFITFNSRPFMTDSGVGYWASGYNASDPNGGTEGRVIYRYDGVAVTAAIAAGTNFSYEGVNFAVDQFGAIDFDFHVSPNDVNTMFLVDAAGEPPTVDNFVLINGVATYREGDPTGDGDNWDNFDVFRIDDSGTHVFSGDTDGDTGSDEFIAVDGDIVIREGMMIDGVLLQSGVTLRGLDLSTNGTVVHAWGSTAFGEVVFVGNISDLAGTSTRLVGVGDVLDLGGGELVTIDDLEASTILPGDLAVSDAAVYANLEVEDGSGAVFELIARFAIGGSSCLGDLDGNGFVEFDDLLEVLANFGTAGPGGDADNSGAVDFDDVLVVLAAFGPCP